MSLSFVHADCAIVPPCCQSFWPVITSSFTSCSLACQDNTHRTHKHNIGDEDAGGRPQQRATLEMSKSLSQDRRSSLHIWSEWNYSSQLTKWAMTSRSPSFSQRLEARHMTS